MERDEELWVEKQLDQLKPAEDWQPDVTKGLELARKSRRGTKMRSLAAAGVLVAVLGVSAFPAPRAVAERCLNACEGLFVKKVDAVPLAIGERMSAPDFSLKDSSGMELRLSALKGRVVLLNFWATWCPPCKAEIPWFLEFERTHRSQGLAIVGVSMDEDGWKAVKPFIDENKINYQIALGNDAISSSFGGIESLPETFVIDRQGRVAAHHIGLVSKETYETEIAKLLEEN